jgi:hypothetical protein
LIPRRGLKILLCDDYSTDASLSLVFAADKTPDIDNGFERLPIELTERILLEVGLSIGLSQSTRGNWFVDAISMLSSVCRHWRLIASGDVFGEELKRRFFDSGGYTHHTEFASEKN